MRIYATLLLLLSAFAVADATPKCDRSVITGITDDKVHFDSATKTLTCHGDNSLGRIKYNERLFESLTCDEADGWKTRGGYKIADASTSLNVTCEEYCKSTGAIVTHSTVMTGPRRGDDAASISCSPFFGLFYNGQEVSSGLDIMCHSLGWENLEAERKTDTATPLQFECREACAIRGGLPSDAHIDRHLSNKIIVKCNNSDALIYRPYIKLNGSTTYNTAVTCDKSGWFPSGNSRANAILADPFSWVTIECAAACTPVILSEGVGVSNDKIDGRTTTYFKCNKASTNGEKYVLKLNGRFVFSKIECDAVDGYIKYDKKKYVYDKERFLADSYDKPRLECVLAPPPCSFTQDEKVHFDNATKKLSCTTDENTTNAIEINYRFEFLTCDEASGWKGHKLNETADWTSKDVAPAAPPLTAGCVKYCSATGKGLKIENYDVDESNIKYRKVKVSCEDESHELSYESRGEKAHSNMAYCVLNLGWHIEFPFRRLHWDTRTPMQFECRKSGSDQDPTTTQNIPRPTAKPPVNTDDGADENDEQPKEAAASSAKSDSLIIAGASIGAIIIIAIIAVVIFKVVSARKRRPAEKKSNMSGKTKSEMSKSEKSKSEKSKTEKTNKSEMSETKSEKTKSNISGRMKKVKSGRKGENSGADHNSSGL